jgi:hypothetical protein
MDKRNPAKSLTLTILISCSINIGWSSLMVDDGCCHCWVNGWSSYSRPVLHSMWSPVSVTLAGSPNKDCYNGGTWSPNKSSSWFGSLYFFLNKSASWTKTPAESRHLNQDCKLLDFYDNHDIWHFLSAASLFLSYMILLTIDDDLDNIPRDKIPVFWYNTKMITNLFYTL